MTLTRILICVGLLCAASRDALSQDNCSRPPVRVSALDNVAETLIIQTQRANFAVTETCHTVRRSTFGTTLSFGIVNRFPDGSAVAEAFVYIKSYRLLNGSPPIKLSLSRGDGWFLQDGGRDSAATAPRMAFVPFTDTIEKWNAAHESAGTPIELSARLGLSWHSFASASGTLSSTVPIEFWKVPSDFDRVRGVQTNYLIRFGVNTDDRASIVPFQVYIQPAVTQVELTLFSNIDALSGTYKFIVQ